MQREIGARATLDCKIVHNKGSIFHSVSLDFQLSANPTEPLESSRVASACLS